VLSAAVACGTLEPDLNQVVAIEVSSRDSLEQFDTLRPRARALNGRGDSVPATILWASLDTVLTVLNDTSGKTVVNRPALTGRLQARVGSLRSNPLSIRALAAADSLFAAGPTAVTVTVGTPDSLSDSLVVELADTTSSGLTGLGPGRPIVWTITDPAAAGPVTLVTNDTAHALVTTDTINTSSAGIAGVRVRLIGPSRPDSVVLTAAARRAIGTTVPGSPVTFVVRFLP
jgi:hypothetical protein